MEQRATVEASAPHAGFARPIPLMPMVGRDQDLLWLEENLADRSTRLLTILGPGGVGKTRLAIEAVQSLDRLFPGGICFIELAALGHASEVPREVLKRIGVLGASTDAIADILVQYNRGEPMLMMFDNFEHVLGAAPMIEQLLEDCPGLQIMVTSQARLRLQAERVFELGPLSLPTSDDPTNEDLHQSGATLLFLERARALRGSFSIEDGSGADVARICRSLDGMPLAIELAASRVNLLTPNAILARLQERPLDLNTSTGGRPERHQHLRSAIRWSYSLLDEDERLVFRQLSVFRGSFSLETASHVIGLPESRDILEVVESLADRSFLRPSDDWETTGRFSLLGAMREFGAEQLIEAGEVNRYRDRHLDWFMTQAEASEDGLIGEDAPIWQTRMSADQSNYRAALEWALDQGYVEKSLRLAAALWRFWVRGGLEENRAWLERALALDGPASPSTRAKAWHTLGNCELDLGNYQAARSAYLRGLDLVDSEMQKIEFARGLNGIGLVSYFIGDYPAAERDHRLALDLRRAEGDVTGIGNSLTNLADAMLEMGAIDEAERLHEEALLVRLNAGDENAVAYSLFNLGVVAERNGNFDRSQLLMDDALTRMDAVGDLLGKAYVLAEVGNVRLEMGSLTESALALRESLEIRRSLGDQRGAVECVERIAEILALAQQPEEAARLFGAAMTHRQRLNAALPPAEQETLERWLQTLESSLETGMFENLAYTGTLMSPSAATNRAMESVDRILAATPVPVDSPVDAAAFKGAVLSIREQEVLRLVAQGLTDQEIADHLFMSRRTATTHQSNIRRKLGAQNRAEAVAFAIRDGIILPPAPSST